MRKSAKTIGAIAESNPAKLAHRVVILVFGEAQMLDVAGPADVFAAANGFDQPIRYTITCASAAGGPVKLSNGMAMHTTPIAHIRPRSVHTLIVAGAERRGLQAALRDSALQAWVSTVAEHAPRVASVCVAAFALAAWGLLNHHKATSHWAAVKQLRSSFPLIEVDGSAIFVRDGKFWTAGGVTTGIDMALAMVEADSSRRVAAQVASMLVMSSRRQGNQAQYSAVLTAQAGRYAALTEWMKAHLHSLLSIATLAAQAHESERSFCRRFTAEVGQTPAQFVEDLRLDAAKQALQGGALAKTAAKAGGFSSAEHLARVFRKRLNMAPQEYRGRHTA